MFKNIIDEIAQGIPGIDNILVGGIDGIIVAKMRHDELDELLVVEAAGLVKEAMRFGSEMQSGNLGCLVYEFEGKYIVIQMISDTYFLIGRIGDTKYLGKLKYHLRLKSYDCYTLVA